MRFGVPGILFAILAAVGPGHSAHAADPQPYRVDFAQTGDGAMDSTLAATSELNSLRESAPVSPFGLIARARGEVDRLKTVLESYGYYQSVVTITIEGMGLNAAQLAETLSALPKDRDARVGIALTLGPLYRLGKVTIDGTLPPSAAGAFKLKSGDPAVAADVLGAAQRVLSTLQGQGYAFAKVDPPVAYEDQTLPVLDVVFRVEPGAQVDIGKIRLEGLVRVREKMVRRRLTLRQGQRYSPSAIEAARRDLLRLGPFDSISVQLGTAADASGGVPVTFLLRERKRHAVTLNAAYSSDLGGSGGVSWTDRNVFGNAEQLNISASLLNLGGGSASTGLGYDAHAIFTKPDFGHRDQSLQVSLEAIKQSLQAYDQKAVTSGVIINRKLSSVWSASAGITTADERISQENKVFNYTLVALPLTVTYDSTNLASPLDDPLHGMRNSLGVTPTHAFGNPGASFIISQIKLAAYLDLNTLGWTAAGRSVVAVRALAGVAQGASEFSLPPDQRFYGGGSGTIRGYRYQSVGPLFPDGNPVGGTAIVAGTLEFRQRFAGNFGGAVFLDGGQVSASLKPLPSDVRFGEGVGIRYYTPIGPIRLDVAVPTHRRTTVLASGGVAKDDAFEIYVGLGQAF